MHLRVKQCTFVYRLSLPVDAIFTCWNIRKRLLFCREGMVPPIMRIRWFSFILLLSSLFVAEAQTINAASCNAPDVQTALNSVAADGTTVNIPAGTCVWTTSVNYTQTYSTTIQGQSSIAGTCAPGGSCTATDSTRIQDNINHGSVTDYALQIATAPNKSFRLTGISFTGYSRQTTDCYNGCIRILGNNANTGGSQSIRIDHNHLSAYPSGLSLLTFDGWLYGVTDHNLFDTSTNYVYFVRWSGGYWNGVNDLDRGHASWTDGPHYGTSKFMYLENNTFNGTTGGPSFAYDCYLGGRLAFRYNQAGIGVTLQTHGLAPGVYRGCRAEEVYNNSFTYTNSPSTSSFAFLLMMESGSGMFWGNTTTGFVSNWYADTIRTSNSSYSYVAPPNGWGYCGTAQTGVASAWDHNTNATGYACIDQVGRGTGHLLTGAAFPDVLDSVTGTITSPNQVSEPVYAWNNTFNAPSGYSPHYWNNGTLVTVENRDYYLQLPNYDESAIFDGTAGIGRGVLSSRPTTCTPYVAYWGTDTNTLYQCSSQNTWTTYYQPYTYPHPLDTSSGGLPTPTNLVATVN